RVAGRGLGAATAEDRRSSARGAGSAIDARDARITRGQWWADALLAARPATGERSRPRSVERPGLRPRRPHHQARHRGRGDATDRGHAPRAPRSGEPFTDVALTQIRKTIAKRLVESIGPIPTFYLTAEFDLTRATEMRAAMAEMGDEFKVSVNDILMK